MPKPRHQSPGNLLSLIFSNFHRLFYFSILVLTAHVVASTVLPIYALWPNVDDIFHFLGGVSIAHGYVLTIRHLYKTKHISRLDPIIEVVFLLALVASTTVFWEFGEYLSDTYLGSSMQGGIPDTMLDMFLGISGGVLTVTLMNKKPKKKRLLRRR